jgi:hypothetical protein
LVYECDSWLELSLSELERDKFQLGWEEVTLGCVVVGLWLRMLRKLSLVELVGLWFINVEDGCRVRFGSHEC